MLRDNAYKYSNNSTSNMRAGMDHIIIIHLFDCLVSISYLGNHEYGNEGSNNKQFL
jgi:hypothetical protein